MLICPENFFICLGKVFGWISKQISKYKIRQIVPYDIVPYNIL